MIRIPIPAFVLSAFLLGCAMNAPGIATSDMWTKGSFVTDAPRAKVRSAVLESLESEGYFVVFDNAPAGRLITSRKILKAHKIKDPTRPADAEDLYISFQIQLLDLGDGRTRVSAIPHIYQAGQELSHGAPDESNMEHERWQSLCKQIQTGL